MEALMSNDDLGRAFFDAALAVAVERAGGELTYTQSEYVAIKARHGSYRIQAEADKSGPGVPRIIVRLVPAPGKERDPVC
jgi:hypothetical protein